jgi:hypothetical protein
MLVFLFFLPTVLMYFLLHCTTVLYLLTNPGGITLYGWTVDRTFLNTILMLELTLVLFVLSQTIVSPASTLMNSYMSFL